MSAHSPEQGMQRTGLLAEEVPSRIMCGSSLWDLSIRLWLDRVDEIREQDGILDEEYRDVVSNDI
jgi:hypothetical protein